MSTPAPYRDSARAQGYDRRIRDAIPGYDTLHHLACVAVAEATGGNGRVLVAGAGTGTECVALAQSCPGLDLVGADPSAAMLAEAEAKVRDLGLAGRVRLHAGLVKDLPTAPPFDAATLLLVLHFLPDDGAKAVLLSDIAARLAPGAPLVLADLFGPGWDDPTQARLHAMWRHLQQAAGFAEAEIERGFRHVERDIHPVTEERLRALLAGAGFGTPLPFFRALCFGGWVARKL